MATHEKIAAFLSLGALAVLVSSMFSQVHFVMLSNQFLLVHTVLEFLSITISYSMAMQGLLLFSHTRSRYQVLLGAAFLAVGSLDLMHTLSYKGMFWFSTDNAISQSAWFGVIARFTEAIALMGIFYWHDGQSRKAWLSKAYGGSIVYSLFVGAGLMLFYDQIPILVDQSQGVTSLKVGIEVVIALLHLATVGFVLRRYYAQPNKELVDVMLSLWFLLLSEMAFSVYKNIYEIGILIGHVYKTMGYFFLLKGVFIPFLKEAYLREEYIADKLNQTTAWLRESQERFQNAFELAGIGMAINTPDGRFLRANAALVNFLGYSENELRQIAPHSITHPDDRERNAERVKQLFAGKIGGYQVEQRYIHKEGYTIWAWINIALVCDSESRPLYFISQIQDITKNKQSQEDLLRLASIVECSSDAIIGKNLEGLVMSWNQAAERMYGYSAQEMIGRPICLVEPQETRINFRTMFDQLRDGHAIQNFETVHRTKDGRLIEVSKTISPIIDGKTQIIGFSSIIRDITEQKKLEREMLRLDRLYLVGEMAAGISHEVRNPMTTVRGFLQLLADKPDCNRYKGYFDLMIQELDRANTIISEFLSIGKNKPDEMQMQNLNEVITALFPLVEADAMRRDKRIELCLGDIPDVLLDSREIRQVILNLSRNGLEAMERGGILTIKTYAEAGQVVLGVQDQGAGIKPEVLEKIGKPFFTTKSNGTGLGLGVCYSIAERHNACIDIETGEAGTTFLVRFEQERSSPRVEMGPLFAEIS